MKEIKNNKSNKVFTIALCIACVVLLLACGLAIYHMLNKEDKMGEVPNEATPIPPTATEAPVVTKPLDEEAVQDDEPTPTPQESEVSQTPTSEPPTPTLLPENTFLITTESRPEDYGTVIGGGLYNLREEVVLEAIPNEGKMFRYWEAKSTGYYLGDTNPMKFYAAENETYIAIFYDPEDVYNITVEVDSDGGGTASGSCSIKHGDQFVIEAVPDRGFEFVGWKKNGRLLSNSEPAMKLYALEDNTVYTAKFRPMEVTPTPLPEVDIIVWEGKLGDNVTGTFWSNGTYVISGRGATYDFWFNQPHNKRDQLLPYIDDVRKIVIEEGITEIGEYAFAWFEECREIVLPSTLTKIKSRAFEECGIRGYWGDERTDGTVQLDNLTPVTEQWFMKVNLQDTSLVHIGSRAFYWTTIENIVFPQTLEVLGDHAFDNCKERIADYTWDDIVIPRSVKQLGQWVFTNKYSIVCEGKESIQDYKLVSEYANLDQSNIEPFFVVTLGVQFRP